MEEVSGHEHKSGEVWRQLASQIYCENGKDRYRQIDHTPSGAPLLEGEHTRISITHTGHLLAVASLPKTPEADLTCFSPRTAMGIDAERADREQVLRIRDRFLSPEEQALVAADDVEANVVAWTVKEALYKAALTEGLDWRASLRIERMPALVDDLDPKRAPACFGSAVILLPAPDGGTEKYPMELYSYRSDDCIVTIAVSPKAAKFKALMRKS